MQLIPPDDAIHEEIKALMHCMSPLRETSDKKQFFAKPKERIRHASVESDLNDDNNSAIADILRGELLFIERSAVFTRYIDPSETEHSSFYDIISGTEGYEKKYFEMLDCLQYQIVDEFLARLNDEQEMQDLDAVWEDLLYAQFFQVNGCNGNEICAEHQEHDSPIWKAGFVYQHSVPNYEALAKFERKLRVEIVFALQNGLTIDQLHAVLTQAPEILPITIDVLKILTSRAAVMLYALKEGFEPVKFLAPTLEQIEMKILQAVALRFSNEKFEEVVDENIRSVLLHGLDPKILANHKLSSFVRTSVIDTQRNLAVAYHNAYQIPTVDPYGRSKSVKRSVEEYFAELPDEFIGLHLKLRTERDAAAYARGDRFDRCKSARDRMPKPFEFIGPSVF